jgi:hypothetical protein
MSVKEFFIMLVKKPWYWWWWVFGAVYCLVIYGIAGYWAIWRLING